MSAQQVIFQYLSAGSNTLTVPPGFSNQVLVYAWGAGGGAGYNGPTGGGGGFAQGIIIVNSGDTVEISVGSRGENGPRDGKGIGGLSYNSLISFNGGSTGTARPQPYNDDQNYGAGGGGGAATTIFVNGVPMIVAAGGGGGGGGRSYQTGTIGTAGGTTIGTPLLGTTVVPPYPVNVTEFNKFVNSLLKGIEYGDYATTFSAWTTLSSPYPSVITSLPGFEPDPNAVAFVDYRGDNKAWSTNINATTITVGSTTYTRGNIAYYTGTTTFSVPGLSYTANVVVYNYTITSLSEVTTLNDRSEGGRSQDGYTVGGGGGGGYPYGGAGGETRGDDAGSSSGGYGGQSYANLTVISAELRPGTTSVAGGSDLTIYPGARRGYAGYDGAVIVIFTKGFRAWIKNSNVWKEISNAWVKVGNTTVRTTSSPVLTTVNYTPNPSTLGGLTTELNSIISTGVSNLTGWYTFNPNLTDLVRDLGLSVTELSDDVRALLNSDLSIDIAGDTIYHTSEDTLTSVTVGENTYTRDSLSYSGAITLVITLDSGTYNWTTTVNAYNFSKTYSEIPTTETVVSEGGWKQITKAWIKEDDVWQPIQSGVSLVPVPSTSETVTINLTIAANTNNYVLSDFLSATSYNPGRSIVNLTVDAGVIVGSTSAGESAMIIDGLATGDLFNLINNGNIAGAGGLGGAAGSYTSVTSGGGKAINNFSALSPKGRYTAGTTTVTSVPGRPGEPGGPALYVTYQTNLVNNGTIAAGGGGGGGGGGPTGGQGGGGAGRIVGVGANNGTLTAGGAGTGLGGAGGARGTAGSAGTNNTNAGGLGGAPGAAILGIDKVTITTAGTIIGERKVIAREVG
jgi:hypothetical protein